MNKNANTILWIASVTIAVLVVTLMSGCYLKDNAAPGFKHYAQGENSRNLMDNDLSKFASSLRKVDGEAVAHYKMALYFQKQKKHKLAIEELKQAVGRDSSYAKAYNAMGVSYDKLRKYSQAIHCYQLALKIDPNLDFAQNNLGYSYLLSNNLDAAIESFQEAIQLNDQNKRYRNNLALAYVMKERYDLAIDQLKDLEGGPHAAETVAKLAHKLGKKDFEKQIVSVLERLTLEKALVRDTKPVPGEDADIQDKTKKQEIEPTGGVPIVVSGRIEKPATDKNISELAHDQAPGAVKPKGAKPSESEMKVGKNETDFKSITNIGSTYTRKSWAEMCAMMGELNENHSTVSVISDADQIPADAGSKNSGAASENENHQQHVNDDQKINNRPIFLAASELYPQPTAGKPVSIEKRIRGISKLTPIYDKKIRKITKLEQIKIKPRVVDVAEIFKQTEENTADPLPLKSSEKLFSVSESKHSSNTWKISPMYTLAFVSSSKKMGTKGLSVIEIAPSRMDKKTKLAASTEERKTEKTNQYIAELEIANGCGVKGAAGRIRALLQESGFNVVKITNANSSDHYSTKIFYQNGHFRTVGHIIKKISCCLDERNIIELEKLGNKIKIIVGKDLS
jgi:lipoprotein NlpI